MSRFKHTLTLIQFVCLIAMGTVAIIGVESVVSWQYFVLMAGTTIYGLSNYIEGYYTALGDSNK